MSGGNGLFIAHQFLPYPFFLATRLKGLRDGWMKVAKDREEYELLMHVTVGPKCKKEESRKMVQRLEETMHP